MRVLPSVRPGLVAAALLLAFSAAAGPAAEPAFSAPVVAGQLAAPPQRETSGLAPSRRSPDLLWTHDDSGGAAALYAVSVTGALRGRLQISGEKPKDWEDLATADLDGRPWLVIGDIGDNDAKRKSASLLFVPEPDPAALAAAGELAARPAFTLKFTYDDGPRDCEALAVDPVERAVYLVSKRTAPARLYRLALPAPLAAATLVARFVGPVPHLANPALSPGFFGRLAGPRIAWPTALDFAPDRSAALVLTYGEPLLFHRAPDESWAAALARPPVRLAPHRFPQAEGACFSADGRAVFVASELVADLLRYDRR